jgi:hypothetical protein
VRAVTFAVGETRLGLRSKHQGQEFRPKMKKFLISVKQSSVSGAGSIIRRKRNKTWLA